MNLSPIYNYLSGAGRSRTVLRHLSDGRPTTDEYRPEDTTAICGTLLWRHQHDEIGADYQPGDDDLYCARCERIAHAMRAAEEAAADLASRPPVQVLEVYLPVRVSLHDGVVVGFDVEPHGAPEFRNDGPTDAVWVLDDDHAEGGTWQTNAVEGPHALAVDLAETAVADGARALAAIAVLREALDAIGMSRGELPGSDVVDLVDALFARLGRHLPNYAEMSTL